MKAATKKATACLLLPTDFQQPARRAFNYGVKFARLLGLRMEILHVIKTPSDRSAPPIDSRYLRSLKTSAMLDLGRLARIATEAGVQVEPCLQFGVPDACILRQANHAHVEIIVMGTEGRAGWDRLRLGSTAHRVVSQTPCPVLAVHGGLAGDAARHPARVKLERLLAATDFSPDADQALQIVSTLARLTQAKVCVVHVAGKGMGRKNGERKLNVLLDGLRRQGLAVEGVCLPGEPVETILSQAAGWEADLISVGTQGRRGLSRLILGSVAEGVLRRAGCPVLVVKHVSPLIQTGASPERRHKNA
ncbi:MAG: universal stress protein [Nitrospira sp.]|nr:universal stress protein [Nitrospira sp.]